ALGKDPGLAARIGARPGLRVPGCWNGFELATRAILGQQITVKGATTLAGRVVEGFGHPITGQDDLSYLFPTPETLADAKLARVGITKQRAEAIRSLARAVCDGTISFERNVDTDAFIATLCRIPGIGPWTARYVAMRALGDPDVLPTGDIGLLRALG